VNRLVSGFLLTGRYRLSHLVAAGGMGQVWSAVDEVLRRTVAVKIMHPQTAEQQAMAGRFRAEARFAAQISHPNIVEVFDFAEHDGLAFLVMEYIDGPTLGQLVAEGRGLPPHQARLVLVQVAGALARAHENGIIHRDLKPSNVLVSPDGYAKLMDFGVAKDMHGASVTTTGEIFGTTYYISPEQALGEQVTPASDLYSLGVMGHELLTGTKPFDRGTPIATALAQVQDPPPPLPDDVPADLARVIRECLAKDPAQRPSAAAVVQALAVNDSDQVFLPLTVGAPTPAVAGTPGSPLVEDDLPLTERWLPA